MRPDLAAAIAGMEARADLAPTAESATAWRHSARVVHLFGDSSRILQQLRQHARFWKEGAPEKAATYREAAELFTRITGTSLPPVFILPHPSPTPAGHQTSFAFI